MSCKGFGTWPNHEMVTQSTDRSVRCCLSTTFHWDFDEDKRRLLWEPGPSMTAVAKRRVRAVADGRKNIRMLLYWHRQSRTDEGSRTARNFELTPSQHSEVHAARNSRGGRQVTMRSMVHSHLMNMDIARRSHMLSQAPQAPTDFLGSEVRLMYETWSNGCRCKLVVITAMYWSWTNFKMFKQFRDHSTLYSKCSGKSACRKFASLFKIVKLCRSDGVAPLVESVSVPQISMQGGKTHRVAETLEFSSCNYNCSVWWF